MLNVKIFSFSYKNSGIPEDNSGNGGGFVFDCRFIYNPGRLVEFMNLTGKDPEVQKFLNSDQEMQNFLNNCYNIIEKAIDKFVEREFTDFMISFGCTGGKHRSVYAAEKLYSHLLNKYDSKINVKLKHNGIV
jgi:RNase adaptor protein for sRNA GlmZ degradation